MQIQNSALKLAATLLVMMIVIGYPLYMTYQLFYGTQDVPGVNTALFGPKIQKAALFIDPANRVSFKVKDTAFIDSPLYKSFTEMPEQVSLSESRGRPDPFVPYVAP